MYNVRPEVIEDQFVTSPSGEALGKNIHMRRPKRIIKSPQWYNPVCGDTRDWNNGAVKSILYMIQDGYFNINVDTDEIL